MDLLDYVLHGKDQGNDQSLQHEQDKRELHRHRDHQQDERDEEVELEGEATLPEDPVLI